MLDEQLTDSQDTQLRFSQSHTDSCQLIDDG